MTITNRSLRAVASAAALFTALVLLAACGGDATADQTADDSADTAAILEISDAWVKTAESGMSAVFATVTNPGDTDVAVVGAQSELSVVELHEVAMVDGEMKMREKDGGFVIPAQSGHQLEPGGDHLMLIDIDRPIQAGDEVTVTLTLDTGETITFTAIAKDFAGGNEEYEHDESGH
ncbi:hypothetical protein FB566_1406 [Stackebrandtia endophytica]|uniref:Copper(I)-binding protein n=1 Tax=Stackebrandtia endophytica TaxID=1496996 RepID=A0A543ATH0_9ACTN|nr:copper chaperone PCu(A)C [Stackebrandtia endophytica]TQL75890.1 hypothetical protein FB566_1406 [Stackebrandtia endophytica]